MEARGVLAVYDADADLLAIRRAKVPHYNRDAIAHVAGDPNKVPLSEGHVGGGFGIRGKLYPEDVLVCAAALRLGRPVKWIEDRASVSCAPIVARSDLSPARGGRRARLHPRLRRSSSPIRTLCAHPRRPDPTSRRGCSGPYVIPAYHVVGRIQLTNNAGRNLSRCRAL